MSRSWWQRWTRRGDALTPGVDPGVSFAWPRDTDLTREQLEIATRHEAAAASVSQPDAGPLPVGETASDAPRPQGILAGMTSKTDADGSVVVYTDDPNLYGHGAAGAGAMLDYADSLVEFRAIECIEAQLPTGDAPVFGDGASMPMRSLSNDNYDRVWIAQGDHVEAMGVGDTPQEAAIEYARAVADLLRPTGGPDAFDTKRQIRAQLAACRGDCGDGPCGCDLDEWAR